MMLPTMEAALGISFKSSHAKKKDSAGVK